MPRWLASALAAACALPTIAILRAGGEVSSPGPSPLAQALTVGAGLALALAAGWARSPVRSRLLAAAAAAWLAALWANPEAPGALLFTAGLAATGLTLPLLLAATLPATRQALLAAPGALALGPLAALASDPRDSGCTGCPPDLLALGSDPALAEWLGRLGAWLSLAACAGAVAIFAVAGLRATAAARRVTLPVTIPAAAFAVATAAGLWLTLQDGAAAPGVRTAHLVAAGTLVALALGTQARPLALRRARRAVTAATTALGATGGKALSDVLGDPTLAVLYVVPGVGWVDADGHTVELPHRTTMIEDRGTAIAALVHETVPAEDLLQEALAAGRLRLDTERLQAAALARVEALRAARRQVVDASEEERSRLERDLHDGTQQQLVAVRFTLGLARSRVASADLAAADAALERALVELRELAHSLYPASLDSDGLATAIPAAAERSRLTVTIGTLPESRLTTEIERTAYRLVAEGLALAERRGASAVHVEATAAGGRLRVRIEHDGGEFGDVTGLDDRVQALAGTLSCAGSRLEAEVPCA